MSAVLAEVTPAAARTLARAATTEPGFEQRPRVGGKFLFVGDQKLWVRGVTYGTFGPQPNGEDYPPDEVLEQDFAAMRANAINAVRSYTVPPRRLLDVAQRNGLRVMVGLPWEQHVAFLDEPGRADDIVRRVARGRAHLRRPPGGAVLRDRQRDPGVDRALARAAPHRALPEAAVPRRQGTRTRARSSPT